jgi:hypothetical protein
MPANFGSDKNLEWKNLGLAVLRGMRAWSEMLSLCVIYMKAMKRRHVFENVSEKSQRDGGSEG